LAWTIGVAFFGYGLSLAARLKSVHTPGGKQIPLAELVPEGLRKWSFWLVAALLVVGLFSSAAVYADMEGKRQAKAIAARLSDLPSVTVYSQSPL
jgi:hypothetical protein